MHAINQPEVMIGNAATRFSPEGELIDEKSQELIRQLLANLAEWTLRIRQPKG